MADKPRKVRRVTKTKPKTSVPIPSTPDTPAPSPEVGKPRTQFDVQPEAKTTPTATDQKVGRPTGTIPNNLKIAYGRGYPWASVTRDAKLFEKYGAMYGVDPAMLMAMMVVESGGEMIWNTRCKPK